MQHRSNPEGGDRRPGPESPEPVPGSRLDPERWRQIDELFGEALELPVEERPAFLGKACGEDSALRSAVEDLLAADARAATFLEASPIRGGEGEPAGDEGRRIGSYELLSSLGRGGMGAVYRARRVDDQFRHEVAVKLLRRGREGPEALARFRGERQILARLDHPNIARLYDGGTTEDGRPYLVMELVDGLPITEYCDRHRLPVNQRLELFRTVCEAVTYAHQNLLIHRDLKPANILVTEKGVAKLLDFGIAKLLDPEQFPGDLPATRTGLRLMTPGYASPEQIRGAPVTTASDVYSLGVVLYELLTGNLPYRASGDTPGELERAICEEAPVKPSMRMEGRPRSGGSEKRHATVAELSRARGAQPRELRRRLAGDLDTIVLNALRKEPERRYRSVEQLSEDLRRHSAQLPVIARPDSLGYRTSKFVRRNRFAVAASSLLLVLVLGFTAALAVQARRLADQRDRAQRQGTRAEQALAYIVSLFEAAAPSEEELTAEQILARGAERLDTELAGQPEMQASLMRTIALIHATRGAYEESHRLAERSLQLLRQHFGDEHPDLPEALAYVASGFHQYKGDFKRAETLYRQALELQAKLSGSDSMEFARILSYLAENLDSQNRFAEAETLHRRGLDIRRRRATVDPLDVAFGWFYLAFNLQFQGDSPAAEEAFLQALTTFEEVWGQEHPVVAQTLSNLAWVANSQHRFAEAERRITRAREIQATLLDPDHHHLGTSAVMLGVALQGLGDLSGAETAFRRAEEILLERLGPEHPTMAQFCLRFGALRLEQGDFVGAEELYRRALAIHEARLSQEDPDLASSRIGLGRVLSATGRTAEAEPLLRSGFAVRRRHLGGAHWLTARAQADLGICLGAQGRAAEAAPLLRESLALLAERFGTDDPLVRQIRAALESSSGAMVF